MIAQTGGTLPECFSTIIEPGLEILYEFYTDNIYDADSIELEFINKYNTFYPNGYNKRRVIRNGK